MTGISWADETWNPAVGCTPVSPGCRLCYAARTSRRLDRCGVEAYKDLARADLLGRDVWSGEVRCLPERLAAPYGWTHPRTVFVGSMTDVFHERIPDAFRDRMWRTMADTTHAYLVLTKRAEAMWRYLARRYRGPARPRARHRPPRRDQHLPDPPPNIAVGVTIESPGQLDRLPWLLDTPAAGRFLSLEPLLAPLCDPLVEAAWEATDPDGVQIYGGIEEFVDWIIVGGESGPGARRMRAAWARNLAQVSTDLDIPFHFKQWGDAYRGRDRRLDGQEWNDRIDLGLPWDDAGRGWGGPDDSCITCRSVRAWRHHRCRGCLRALRAVQEGA